jgi:hypothetical protein
VPEQRRHAEEVEVRGEKGSYSVGKLAFSRPHYSPTPNGWSKAPLRASESASFPAARSMRSTMMTNMARNGATSLRAMTGRRVASSQLLTRSIFFAQTSYTRLHNICTSDLGLGSTREVCGGFWRSGRLPIKCHSTFEAPPSAPRSPGFHIPVTHSRSSGCYSTF